MSGFTVRPDALDAHAGRVEAVAADIDAGAAAEVTGAGQADFGLLIGQTIGYGIRAVAGSAEQSLHATAAALSSTAAQLRATAEQYRQAEASSRAGLGGTEPAP